MPYAREALVQSVAERLGLAGDGQAPEADDDVKIRAALEGIGQDLVAREVLPYLDLDSIDDALFDHVAAIVASQMADRFGTDDAQASRLAGRAQGAEQRIRTIVAVPFVGRTARVTFF